MIRSEGDDLDFTRKCHLNTEESDRCIKLTGLTLLDSNTRTMEYEEEACAAQM